MSPIPYKLQRVLAHLFITTWKTGLRKLCKSWDGKTKRTLPNNIVALGVIKNGQETLENILVVREASIQKMWDGYIWFLLKKISSVRIIMP